MGEKLRNNWRMGLAVPLLVGGFWYEAHASDQAAQGNTETAVELGVEGAVLLAGGATLAWRNSVAEGRRNQDAQDNPIPPPNEE